MPPPRSRRDSDPNSPLYLYLQDINATPLLSAEEEVGLARRIAEGDPEAREHMVKANLRLVVNIARGYMNKGLGLEDLIEEGNLGPHAGRRGVRRRDVEPILDLCELLDQAIDPPRGDEPGEADPPAGLHGHAPDQVEAGQHGARREARAGRRTPEEIGRNLRLSRKKVGIVAKAIRVNNLTPHPDTPEDGNLLDDMLTDDRAKSPGDMLIEADDLERIYDELNRLDDRESAVIRMRFGLTGRRPPHAPRDRRDPGPDPRARPPAGDGGDRQADECPGPAGRGIVNRRSGRVELARPTIGGRLVGLGSSNLSLNSGQAPSASRTAVKASMANSRSSRRVGRRDLDADAGLALGHDGVEEPDRVDAPLQQPLGHPAGQGRVADHDRRRSGARRG